MFSSATLEQIRAASDIVEVIGGYLPLKRAGANFVALCPFHKEKSPSFNVNPHKQIFHCFGCHKGGDVFTFVREYESIPFMDAVRRLAERAHIPLEETEQPGQQQARHIKETLLQIHEQITMRWQSALANDAAGQIARDYLAKRGVPEAAVQQFRLGYAPEKWDDTVNWAISKNFDLETVEKGGLIIRKEKEGGGERFYDRFRGRLIFPICDEQGRVIGFSGRVLSGDEKTAKYVNSPETPIFTKGKVIYGLDKSKRTMLDRQFAIICEGQLDLIACFMADVKNVVAPQGTALTADHCRILKRYVEEVVLCFDSDNAGRNAAIRSLDDLLASGMAIRVATVPPPHDPDSYIKEFGGPAFQKVIEKAEGFFDFYLHHLCTANDVTSDKGKLAVMRSMVEAVQKTGSVVLLDTYAQKTALRLGISVESARTEFKKTPRQQPLRRSEPEESLAEPEEIPLARPSPQEFWLLKITLLHDELAGWLAQQLNLDWIGHPLVRQIVSACLAAHENQVWHGPATMLAELENTAAQSLVTEVVAESRPIPHPEKQLPDIVMRLRNQYIDRQLASLNQRASMPNVSDEEHLSILHERQRLVRLKQEKIT